MLSGSEMRTALTVAPPSAPREMVAGGSGGGGGGAPALTGQERRGAHQPKGGGQAGEAGSSDHSSP